MMIREKIVLLAGTIISLLILASMSSSLYMTQEKVLSYQHAANLQIADYVKSTVDLYVVERTSGVESASRRNDTLDALLTRDPAKMAKVVDEITGINQRVDIILNIGIADSNCIGIANDRETAVSVAGRNFSDRDHCKGILATKQRYVSSSYISSLSSKPVLSVNMPVKEKNGNLVGYFVTTVGIDKLSSYFVSLQAGNGRLILLDRAGNEFIDTGDPPRGETENQNEISIAVRHELANGATEGSLNSIDKQGEQYIADFKKFDYITVIIAEKRSAALSMMPNLVFTSLLISIAAIFLSFSLFWLIITRLVTSKLGRITSAIMRISTGDMSVKIDDDLKNENDEVGELARAFDRTIAGLKLAMLRTGVSPHDIGLGKALSAKKEAEERYAALFNSINEIVTVNKISSKGPGKFVDVNEYACRALGYSREEFLNMGPQDLDDSVKPKDAVTANNVKQMLSGKMVEYTSINRTKSGRKLTLLLRMRLFDFKGEKYIISTGRDITERKQMEEAKREGEARYRVITDQSPIAIEFYNESGTLVNVNPACLSLFGVKDMKEIKGFALFADPNISDEHKNDLRRGKTIHYQSVFDFEKVKKANLYRTTRSGVAWLDVLITPLKGKSDSVGGYLIHIQDITARKMAEDTLAYEKKVTETVLAAVHQGVDIVDEGLNIIYMNPAFEKIFGKSAVGKKCYQIYKDNKRQCDACPLKKPIKIGETRKLVVPGIKDGKVFEISHTGILLPNGKKAILETFRDVTAEAQSRDNKKGIKP